MIAYKFLHDDFRSGKGDESPWVVGETRTHAGPVVLCQSGYHWSDDWYDALQYAPGSVAAPVDVSEPVAREFDKGVSRSMTVLAMVNVEHQLRLWGCDCAERALLRERDHGREPDARSWAAIEVARAYSAGEATREDLTAAGKRCRAR